MSSPICVKALLDWTTIFYFWKWCHSVFDHFASAFIFKTNLKLRYPRLVTNLIHRFAISSFLKRAKPAVQREYQFFYIETITVLPWIEKSSFNVRVRALVKAIACHQFSDSTILSALSWLVLSTTLLREVFRPMYPAIVLYFKEEISGTTNTKYRYKVYTFVSELACEFLREMRRL